MKSYSGGCLCGAVRYRITSDPGPSRVCWCKDCQHISSNGTVNAVFPSASIEVTGTPAGYDKTADSGNTVTRRFCATCGSQLFSDSTGRPGLTVVRVGTLDDPSAIRPTANIWAASAPGWACLDAGLDRFEGAPAPPAPRRGSRDEDRRRAQCGDGAAGHHRGTAPRLRFVPGGRQDLRDRSARQ
ncbi:GFA family protein [Ramlibacter terrae]|uniref:GFA family protein n=1 Tax=Ramlibacter terrae TaxID=2732511 RepID=A0ABX6P813_9BURK|nr:GFA family protein [Ramlibacter terrae]